MTIFDAVVLGVIAVSVFFAAYRGALRETLTLAALALAAWLAFVSVGPILSALGMKGSFFGLIFVAAVVATLGFAALYVGGALLLGRFKLEGRNALADRVGGGAIGLVRALALVGLGFLGYGFYTDEAQRPDAVTRAALLPVAEGAANAIASLAPYKNDGEPVPAVSRSGAAEEDELDDDLSSSSVSRRNLEELVGTVTTTDGHAASAVDAAASGDVVAADDDDR